MIKITFSKAWSYTEPDGSLVRSFNTGVTYDVSNNIAIAAAKDKACYTPAALALFAASGEKAAPETALSKMTKADLAAEVKASRAAVDALATANAKREAAETALTLAKSDLEEATANNNTLQSELATLKASANDVIALFNHQTGGKRDTLADVLADMKELGAE